MTEIREVPMAEFAEWSQMMCRERGAVRLTIVHKPECPTLRPGAAEAMERVLERVQRGEVCLSVACVGFEYTCNCEVVDVEIE